jgi:hypothetical protein
LSESTEQLRKAMRKAALDICSFAVNRGVTDGFDEKQINEAMVNALMVFWSYLSEDMRLDFAESLPAIIPDMLTRSAELATPTARDNVVFLPKGSQGPP